MSSEWALEIMRKAPYITVSFTRPDGSAYGLPLSLAAKDDNTWYFHCALEGDKLDAIKAHPEVCLSAVTNAAPPSDRRMAPSPCNISQPSPSVVPNSWIPIPRRLRACVSSVSAS